MANRTNTSNSSNNIDITNSSSTADSAGVIAKGNIKKTAIKELILAALFAALTGVCSMIAIPLPFTPVPINLATLSVFLAGALLGSKYGGISQLVYILLGAIGLPVFSNFTGGVGILAGPTGGYIIGYAVAAFLVGLIIELGGKRKSAMPISVSTKSKVEQVKTLTKAHGENKTKKITSKIYKFALWAVAMVIGLVACYVLGTAWFMYSTGTNLATSMVYCVIPFLPGDALKIVAATLLVNRLKPVIQLSRLI